MRGGLQGVADCPHWGQLGLERGVDQLEVAVHEKPVEKTVHALGFDDHVAILGGVAEVGSLKHGLARECSPKACERVVDGHGEEA